MLLERPLRALRKAHHKTAKQNWIDKKCQKIERAVAASTNPQPRVRRLQVCHAALRATMRKYSISTNLGRVIEQL